MTTSQDTTKSAAERLQELHRQIDEALAQPGTGVNIKELRAAATDVARQQGREAGELANRIDDLEAAA